MTVVGRPPKTDAPQEDRTSLRLYHVDDMDRLAVCNDGSPGERAVVSCSLEADLRLPHRAGLEQRLRHICLHSHEALRISVYVRHQP
jgi:hypothetical protein